MSPLREVFTIVPHCPTKATPFRVRSLPTPTGLVVTHSSATAGNTYEYTVVAYVDGAAGDVSNTVSVTVTK